ncbi:MBL fold metallo-hydrolase [Bacillaceae bacterium]
MKIETFVLGPLQTNAYLLTNEHTNESIVIDPGAHPQPLLAAAKKTNVVAVLLTHAHFDHIAGLEELRQETGAPVYIHPSEQEWLGSAELNGSAWWADLTPPVKTAKAENLVHDGQTLTLAGFTIKVLHTPGHSPGGVSYLLGNDVFSGDALFAGSIGRTDLPGGNYEQLIESIQEKLLELPDEVKVYPGHGPATSIGREKNYNPFITGILR